LPLIAKKNTLKSLPLCNESPMSLLFTFVLICFHLKFTLNYIFSKIFNSFLIFPWSGNQSEHHRVSVISAENKTKATGKRRLLILLSILP